jgi:hypothetical protein
MANFHKSMAMVKGIMGPIGSGKSVACVMEVLNRARSQAADRHNVRRSRWAVIRNTYPELKSTTLKTWREWIPESVCPIKFSAPIEARMNQLLPDGTTIDMEVIFIALDRPDDVKKLLSLELTGVWINEARELDKSIVDAALSRTGRYPGKRFGAGLTWTGLILDTNPMDDDHWWYTVAELKKPKDWAFFRQPGALIKKVDHNGRVSGYEANPHAENVENQQLGYNYWMRLIEGADPAWVEAMVCGKYSSVFDGKPVYKDIYNDEVHVARHTLDAYEGLPLLLGWDFGLTPSCIVGQMDPMGQLRILREYLCKRGGIKQFTMDTVAPRLNADFGGIHVRSWGDPAGTAKSQADDSLSCFSMLEELGIYTVPTITNDFLPRRQAVIDRLTRTIDGRPAFILDPSISKLRKGFQGGYKFERVQVSGEERYKDVPSKNQYSHPHDALQYLCLGIDSLHVDEHTRDVPLPPSHGWGGV